MNMRSSLAVQVQLKKVVITNAVQKLLRPSDVSPGVRGYFDQICTIHAHWFLASDQNSDIVIRFNDSDLKKNKQQLFDDQKTFSRYDLCLWPFNLEHF